MEGALYFFAYFLKRKSSGIARARAIGGIAATLHPPPPPSPPFSGPEGAEGGAVVTLSEVNALMQTLVSGNGPVMSDHVVPSVLTKLCPLPAFAFSLYPSTGISTGTGYLYPGVVSRRTIENRLPSCKTAAGIFTV